MLPTQFLPETWCFQTSQKVNIRLGYLCNIIFDPELLKIAQTGHTSHNTDKSLPMKWNHQWRQKVSQDWSQGDEAFTSVVKNLDSDLSPKNLAVINENMIQRKNVIRNTVIKESDLDKLNLAEAIDTGKTSFGNPFYRTVEPVDLILVDNLQYAPGSQVCLLYVIQTHLGWLAENSFCFILPHQTSDNFFVVTNFRCKITLS